VQGIFPSQKIAAYSNHQTIKSARVSCTALKILSTLPLAFWDKVKEHPTTRAKLFWQELLGFPCSKRMLKPFTMCREYGDSLEKCGVQPLLCRSETEDTATCICLVSFHNSKSCFTKLIHSQLDWQSMIFSVWEISQESRRSHYYKPRIAGKHMQSFQTY